MPNFELTIQAAWPTGSRYICVPAPTDTDTDYVVLVANLQTAIAELKKVGWSIGGEDNESYTNQLIDDDELSWFSAKKRIDGELVNYIVMTDVERFNKWVTATELCKKLNLLKKDQRIAVFQVIVEGEKLY